MDRFQYEATALGLVWVWVRDYRVFSMAMGVLRD